MSKYLTEEEKQKRKAHYWAHREEILEQQKQYREAYKNELRERRRQYYAAHREEFREYQKQYQRQYRRAKESRLKDRARDKVYYAIRCGKLTRKPCENCGEVKSEAHHDNYNKPLEVRWLCRKCHADWHKNNKPIY